MLAFHRRRIHQISRYSLIGATPSVRSRDFEEAKSGGHICEAFVTIEDDLINVDLGNLNSMTKNLLVKANIIFMLRLVKSLGMQEGFRRGISADNLFWSSTLSEIFAGKE